jgi:archaetidylinositol phosphate synthase
MCLQMMLVALLRLTLDELTDYIYSMFWQKSKRSRRWSVLDRLRGSLRGVLDSLGSAAANALPWPTAWTLIGVFFAFLAALYYGGGFPVAAGVLVIFSGFFDVLDGAVARATGKTSARGAFLDSTLDRLSEMAIFLGILVGNYVSPVFVLLALSLSLMVSYTRAKADSLGVNLAGIGVGERSERLVVLIVTSLLSTVWLGVLIVAILALITFVQRTITVSRALGRPPKGAVEGSPPGPA